MLVKDPPSALWVFFEEPLHQSRAAASLIIKEPFITREINEEIKAVKVQEAFFFFPLCRVLTHVVNLLARQQTN